MRTDHLGPTTAKPDFSNPEVAPCPEPGAAASVSGQSKSALVPSNSATKVSLSIGCLCSILGLFLFGFGNSNLKKIWWTFALPSFYFLLAGSPGKKRVEKRGHKTKRKKKKEEEEKEEGKRREKGGGRGMNRGQKSIIKEKCFFFASSANLDRSLCRACWTLLPHDGLLLEIVLTIPG